MSPVGQEETVDPHKLAAAKQSDKRRYTLGGHAPRPGGNHCPYGLEQKSKTRIGGALL